MELAIKKFSSDVKAQKFFEQMLWEDGLPRCPHCGSKRTSLILTPGRRIQKSPLKFHRCRNCCKKFTIITNTYMHSSKIDLRKWATAIYLVCACKKSISSRRLSAMIGVSQRTAWYMIMRISEGDKQILGKFTRQVQVDEAFCGGKNKNRHADKKVKNNQGRSYKDKTAVFGIIEEETKKAKAFVIPNTNSYVLCKSIKDHVEFGTHVIADDWQAYSYLKDFLLTRVKTKNKKKKDTELEEEPNPFNTNKIENFWNRVKTDYAEHRKISRRHLQRYIDSSVTRFNHHELSPDEKMISAVKRCTRGQLRLKMFRRADPQKQDHLSWQGIEAIRPEFRDYKKRYAHLKS